MDAGEGVWVLLAAKTLVECQRERVCLRHIVLRERWRAGRRRWAFYGASPGGQPCRVPQLVTWPRILTGSHRSGWAARGAEFLLAAERVDRRLEGGVAAGDAAAGAGVAD